MGGVDDASILFCISYHFTQRSNTLLIPNLLRVDRGRKEKDRKDGGRRERRRDERMGARQRGEGRKIEEERGRRKRRE